MANFDPKRVTPIEWAGIGAGVAAFLFSFFPWLSVEVFGDLSVSGSAWQSGFLAWFSVLLLVGAGAVVLLPHMGTDVPNRTVLWLSFAGVAVLFILLRWITLDSFVGASIGLFLGLLAAIVSAAAAFLSFQAAKRTTA
ncbi:hypothetical protein GCM10023148_39260 [Actinokineospora soli]